MEHIDNRTECKNGHPFNESNNYKNKEGYYRCRVCNKLRMRKVNSTSEAKAKNVARVKAWTDANREHYREYCRNRRAKTSKWLQEYKSQGCMNCGELHLACLDFHHRDATKKKFNIGVRSSAVAMQTLIEEVAKCDILCANCHRKLHAQERKSVAA